MIIGIVGLGTVGFGTLDILTKEKQRLEKTIGEEVTVKYGCALENPGVPEGVIFTKDYNDVLNDESVDVVVELIGGLTFAKKIILGAIEKGKHVVTANKALLAHDGQEIFSAASKKGVNVFYEASVGGGIPVVVPARESLIANNIQKIEGILNGTTNFILTLMETDNLDFKEALGIAKDLGYVEANEALDLDGYDAAHKIAIMAMNAFHVFFDFDKVSTTGIRDVTKADMDYAKKLGYRIKLIAQAKKLPDSIGIDVSPTLVPMTDIVGSVMQAYNVVEITSDYVENVLFYGKGAGRYVTASAVVADIMKTHNKELWTYDDYTFTDAITPIDESRFYLRSSKPLDVDYEESYSMNDDYIYITTKQNINDLKIHLSGAAYTIFKVRD